MIIQIKFINFFISYGMGICYQHGITYLVYRTDAPVDYYTAYIIVSIEEARDRLVESNFYQNRPNWDNEWIEYLTPIDSDQIPIELSYDEKSILLDYCFRLDMYHIPHKSGWFEYTALISN
jgi:hypothetical protein